MKALPIWTLTRFLSKVATFSALISLSACANFSAVNKKFSPNNHQSIAIDAKQRVVFSIEKNFGVGKKWTAVCAEPSPDALAAISASTGVDAKVLEKALNFATSSQETAASIGLRTQTIQILRDAMYRLCEAYASSAMDNIDFAQAQRRYQDVMLALLSIEQLTGVVSAKQVGIGGQSEAVATSGIDSMEQWIDKSRAIVDEKKKQQLEAQAAKVEKKTTWDEAEAQYKTLIQDAGTDAEKLAKAEEFQAATVAPARKAFEDEEIKAAAADAEVAKQQLALDELIEAQKSVGSAAAKQVGTVAFEAVTSPTGGFTEKTAAIIAKSVVDIVKLTTGAVYIDEWCFHFLRETFNDNSKIEASALAQRTDLANTCLARIKNSPTVVSVAR